MKLIDDKKWLMEKLAQDDGGCISVGGLMLELMTPVERLTFRIRGMINEVRDNPQSFREQPEFADLAIASMQLAQIAKGLMEECDVL